MLNATDMGRQIGSRTRLTRATLILGAVWLAAPSAPRAQLGTGGVTGGTPGIPGGTLTGMDMFLSVQRTKGVNLVERDRGRLLNRVNCQCQTPAFLRAVILPSAAARAVTVNPSATVSMYVGNNCNNITTIGCCKFLGSTPYSTFRQFGMISETTVDQLTRTWSTTNCGVNATGNTGTGGAAGTGGGSGAGGAGGAGGASGTGGAVGTTTGTGPCNGIQVGQSLWVFIGTSGDGSMDVATASLGFTVDPQPPPAPSNLAVQGANQALIVKWTPLETAFASDIIGYQLMCTRAERTQVFKDGTFTPAFDSCANEVSTDWPESPPAKSAFVCSDLLSASTSSARLKILENDITYRVGVVAVDRQGNASIPKPEYGMPVATRDFYYDYRHGEPQGSAVGGFCAVSGVASAGVTASVLGVLGALALAVSLGRRRSRGGKGERK